MKSLKFHNRQVLMLWVVVVCNLLLPGFHKFRFSLKTPRSWGLEQIPITSADSFSPENWNIISSSLIKKSMFCTKQGTCVQYSYLKALWENYFLKKHFTFFLCLFHKTTILFLNASEISGFKKDFRSFIEDSIDRNLFEPFWWMRC